MLNSEFCMHAFPTSFLYPPKSGDLCYKNNGEKNQELHSWLDNCALIHGSAQPLQNNSTPFKTYRFPSSHRSVFWACLHVSASYLYFSTAERSPEDSWPRTISSRREQIGLWSPTEKKFGSGNYPHGPRKVLVACHGGMQSSQHSPVCKRQEGQNIH